MADRPSSKATNSEIVKALIVITQDFFNHNPGPRPGENPEAWGITIDENTLVDRISMALNSYAGRNIALPISWIR